MRNWTMAALPLALAMTIAGCNGADHKDGERPGKDEKSAATDAGPMATRTYALTGFTGVKVAGPDDVTIRRGDTFSISAKGPQAVIDELDIVVDGQTLSIGRQRPGFSFSSRDHEDVEIAITMPRLIAVRLTGSGSIDADSVDGDAVEAAVTGSGDLKITKLNGKSAEISVSGSGDIEIGGGTIGAGEFGVTGSGNVEAQATGKADVSILGSGDVTLSGGATCSTRQLGSGSVTCK